MTTDFFYCFKCKYSRDTFFRWRGIEVPVCKSCKFENLANTSEEYRACADAWILDFVYDLKRGDSAVEPVPAIFITICDKCRGTGHVIDVNEREL
jgi:hypothetical protein